MDERVLTPRNRGSRLSVPGVDRTAPVATDVPRPDHTADSAR
ncbi:hypothetical protein [Streptomyces zaomyceticus]